VTLSWNGGNPAEGDETVLYSFCPNGDPCTDDKSPGNRLLLNGQGNIFGTTNFGGADGDYGTAFALKP
jgi:hypothetical protein